MLLAKDYVGFEIFLCLETLNLWHALITMLRFTITIFLLTHPLRPLYILVSGGYFLLKYFLANRLINYENLFLGLACFLYLFLIFLKSKNRLKNKLPTLLTSKINLSKIDNNYNSNHINKNNINNNKNNNHININCID